MCVLPVFKLLYYYDKYKCFVFYIVLECVLNHNVVCDVIWIKSVTESHLAFELTFVAHHVFLTSVFYMWPMKKMMHFCTPSDNTF